MLKYKIVCKVIYKVFGVDCHVLTQMTCGHTRLRGWRTRLLLTSRDEEGEEHTHTHTHTHLAFKEHTSPSIVCV